MLLKPILMRNAQPTVQRVYPQTTLPTLIVAAACVSPLAEIAAALMTPTSSVHLVVLWRGVRVLVPAIAPALVIRVVVRVATLLLVLPVRSHERSSCFFSCELFKFWGHNSAPRPQNWTTPCAN